MHVAVWGSIPKKNQESDNPAGNFWVSDLNLSIKILRFIIFILSFMWSFFLWPVTSPHTFCQPLLQSSFWIFVSIFIPTYNSLSMYTLYSFLFFSEVEEADFFFLWDKIFWQNPSSSLFASLIQTNIFIQSHSHASLISSPKKQELLLLLL